MPGFGFSESLIGLGHTFAKHVTRAAPTQGGVISGENPTTFTPTDPLRLWVIQLILVIVTTQILSLLLRSLRQPRVISEVISGMILGPSVLGRIPGFTKTIFPPESLPYLNLTANIGLVLFLFLVGLEVDVRLIVRNARYSVFVAAAGMILPFGLGTGVASAVYNKFVDHEQVSFGHFLLFVGVAFAITAFPVLCRILTELNLLETTVGIVVLSAGVGNDIIAWVLLALSVSLVNASSSLTAVWILLATTGFALFILIPMKYFFVRLARHTGALEEGQPSAFMMTVTLLLVFASAFTTDILGVHPIFGGFLAGLVIPHESGFAIALVEKLEDLVSLLFLPLYFTLSGLKTDLGLLNNGITWAYTFLIMIVAFVGKFAGASITSKFLGFNWREAGAIGILMSCKGLVELIVLNIGLQAGILDPRVFAMFVVEALVLTFITTPLTLLVYPPEHRTLHSGARNAMAKDEEATEKDRAPATSRDAASGNVDYLNVKKRIAVMLHKLEHISPLMTMTQLLGSPLPLPAPKGVSGASGSSKHGGDMIVEEAKDAVVASNAVNPSQAVQQGSNSSGLPPASPPTQPTSSFKLIKETGPTLDAIRLVDLSDRTSAVMYGSVTTELHHRDPLLGALRTFARLHHIPMVTSALAVTPYDEFPAKICERAKDVDADLILLPWNTALYPVVEHRGKVESDKDKDGAGGGGNVYNPFEHIFGGKSGGSSGANSSEKAASIVYAQLVRKVFSLSSVDVALFIENDGSGYNPSHFDHANGQGSPGAGGQDHSGKLDEGIVQPLIEGQHLFLPYFGGPDDRLALNLVVQLCSNPNGSVIATVVRFTKTEPDVGADISRDPSKGDAIQPEIVNSLTVQSASGFPDTIYDPQSTQNRLASETADNIAWNRFANRTESSMPLPTATQDALTRIKFMEKSTPTPLAAAISQISDINEAEQERGRSSGSKDLNNGGWRKGVVVVTGRGRRLAAEDHHDELKTIMHSGGVNSGKAQAHVGADARKTLGDVGAAFAVARPADVSMLVMQSAHDSTDV